MTKTFLNIVPWNVYISFPFLSTYIVSLNHSIGKFIFLAPKNALSIIASLPAPNLPLFTSRLDILNYNTKPNIYI